MAYVTLDSAGNITGIFANPQPQLSGYATIADTDSRIAAFVAAAATPSAPTLSQLQAQLNTLTAEMAQLSATPS